MRFSVLASGSKGNACYVETSKARIIIDAGLSARETIKRLDLIEIQPEKIDGLFITHEHSDHIKGAGPLARRLDIPVYINGLTMNRCRKRLGNLSTPVTLQTGQSITIHDLQIETFTKCHDAADPIGLIISSNGSRLGILTDVGRSTRLIEDRLRKCNGLILEFNHDPEMLMDGPYPLDLKRRVKGPDGHLSNQQACDLLEAVSHPDLSLLVLAHISDVNNMPDIARKKAGEGLARCGLKTTKIIISSQDRPTELEEL